MVTIIRIQNVVFGSKIEGFIHLRELDSNSWHIGNLCDLARAKPDFLGDFSECIIFGDHILRLFVALILEEVVFEVCKKFLFDMDALD